MEIPRELDNLRYLCRIKEMGCGSVVRIKGSLPFESDKYHVFLVLGKSSDNWSMVVAVNGTTKYHKRLAYHSSRKTNEHSDPLVQIRAGKYPFFSKDTCIDCSQVSVIDIKALDSGNIEFLDDKFTDDDLSNIVERVMASDLVSPVIKQIVSTSYYQYR